MIINRLDRFDRIELVPVEINIDYVSQLLLGRATGDHRLWHNSLDRWTQIQIKADAARYTAIEGEPIDVSQCKWAGAEDVDQVRVIRKGFCKPNDHLPLGIAKSDVGRGDELIVTAGENQW